MYLISAYFDELTSHTINRYIRQIAEKTKNRKAFDQAVLIQYNKYKKFNKKTEGKPCRNQQEKKK